MLKLLLIAVVGLALVSSEANDGTFTRDLGPMYLTLQAGDGERFPVEPSTRSTIISNRIINLLNGYKEDLQNGNDRHGVLDVYTADVLGPYTVGTSINVLARLRVILNNLRCSGISSYDIQNLVFSLLRMNLNLHMKIPEITVNTGYSAEERVVLFITHRASGVFSLLIRGIDINGRMQLFVASGGRLQTSSFEVDVEVGSTHMHISELTGIGFVDWLLNWVIQNISQDVIQQNMANISETISSSLLDIVNDLLGGFTLEDLLG